MTVTVHFSSEEQADPEAQAAAAGLSAEEWLRKIVRERAAASAQTNEEPAAQYRPISQVIRDIMSDTPAEELAKLPPEGASQNDHYIYGHLKR